MSLLSLIQQRTESVSERTRGRFRVEVDEATKQAPVNLAAYVHYEAYLFERDYENPYPLFVIDSAVGSDYPAEMRFTDERGITPIQINSPDELLSNLDMVLQDDFLVEHVRLVSRRPQFARRD